MAETGGFLGFINAHLVELFILLSFVSSGLSFLFRGQERFAPDRDMMELQAKLDALRKDNTRLQEELSSMRQTGGHLIE
ncbi:MAG: hypothetical protein AAGF19_02910 [Pseudomonadota bacterium]